MPTRWAKKKFKIFFFKGPHFSVQNGPFFNFSHCKWSFLIDRRSSLEILVFSPRSKFGGAKRLARTGREDGQEKRRKNHFLRGEFWRAILPFWLLLAIFDLFWFFLANFWVDSKYLAWTSGWHWPGGSNWSIFKVFQCDFWSFFVILGQFFPLLLPF